ncbi:MAG: aminopeptidase P family N-terminal domain-containing protein [Chakrabartia sp.]
MSSHAERLAALRSAFGNVGIDGFILSTGDEHLTEFPAPYSRRLHWLCGFSGSTGSVAVLNDAAAIFVDARYTGTVRNQVDAAHWSFEDVPATNIGRWLADNAAGRRIGFDPKLYSSRALNAIEEQSGAQSRRILMASPPH